MAEKTKVIKGQFNSDLYRKLAMQKVKDNDLLGALGFLFSALREVDVFGEDKTFEIYGEIADVYSDLGLLEHSNKYWFKYMQSAPKDKLSVAYGELAVNFFYLEDLWASGYYFHKKISADGFISKENLDPEIVEFLNDEVSGKDNYFLAYPYSRADYSAWVKRAKRLMALNDFEGAERVFASIPEECLKEDATGDYAISLYVQNKQDEVIKLSKNSLKLNGENVTAFCNLSMAYRAKGDLDKASYYYKRALELTSGEGRDVHKIATCALEEGDTKTALENIKKILLEHPNDPEMLFFYGLAHINSGDYAGGIKELKKGHRIAPSDIIIKYYYNLAKALEKGDAKAQSLLPLSYVKELPKSVANNHRRRINEWTKDLNRAFNVIDKDDRLEVLTWGAKSSDFNLAKKSIYVLARSKSPKTVNLINELLIDDNIHSNVKRVAVFALIAGGYRGRISALVGNVMVRGKPAKLVFDNHPLSTYFVSAYALCVSKMLFFGFEDTNKLAFAANKVFSRLSDSPSSILKTSDELAALILYVANQQKFNDKDEICAIFNVEKQALEELINEYKGGVKK